MKLFQKQLVTGLIIMTGATGAQASAQAIGTTEDPTSSYVPLVFAQTYVSAGAAATFGGDIVATTYFVGGAENTITGSIKAGAAITLGAGSNVNVVNAEDLDSGNTESGTATTLGAEVTVERNSSFITSITKGAGAQSLTENLSTVTLGSYSSGQVTDRRTEKSILDAGQALKNELISTMNVDTRLNPSGDHDGVDSNGNRDNPTNIINSEVVVYNLASLTTGAGITLSLTCGVDYVFNIADMLSLGAGTKIVMSDSDGNPCTEDKTVTWNLGGYASIGEAAEMIGTILANGYISTGVNSVTNNGGLYSETSYVTIGASGTVN
jgi:hypothetical protein